MCLLLSFSSLSHRCTAIFFIFRYFLGSALALLVTSLPFNRFGRRGTTSLLAIAYIEHFYGIAGAFDCKKVARLYLMLFLFIAESRTVLLVNACGY